MNKIGKMTLTFLVTFLVTGNLFSQDTTQETAPDAASAIIRKTEEQNSSESSKMEISMLIYPDSDVKDSYRTYRITAYGKGDDDSYMEFISPRAITGLRILSRGDDQWVYFSSTGRVRKIAGKSKKESVQGVGGDFSYEDLGGRQLNEKYNFIILKSDTNQWILEGLPKEPDNTYTKIVVSVTKSNFFTTKIEYYTNEDGHYKDLIMAEIKQMGGREVATRMIMANYVKKSMTVILTHAVSYDIPVDEKYFNPGRFYK